MAAFRVVERRRVDDGRLVYRAREAVDDAADHHLPGEVVTDFVTPEGCVSHSVVSAGGADEGSSVFKGCGLLQRRVAVAFWVRSLKVDPGLVLFHARILRQDPVTRAVRAMEPLSDDGPVLEVLVSSLTDLKLALDCASCDAFLVDLETPRSRAQRLLLPPEHFFRLILRAAVARDL